MSVTTVLVKAAYVTIPRSAESGTRTASAGEVVTVPDAVAKRWIRLAAAELVDAAHPPGGGSTPPPEAVEIEVDGETVDLLTIDDADRLRQIADGIDGLDIPGNVKKAETLRERIVEHVKAHPAGGGDE